MFFLLYNRPMVLVMHSPYKLDMTSSHPLFRKGDYLIAQNVQVEWLQDGNNSSWMSAILYIRETKQQNALSQCVRNNLPFSKMVMYCATKRRKLQFPFLYFSILDFNSPLAIQHKHYRMLISYQSKMPFSKEMFAFQHSFNNGYSLFLHCWLT